MSSIRHFIKQKIRNWLLSDVVKVTIPNDVIRENKGILYLGSQKISTEELRGLISEAKSLENMRLWSILNQTMKQLAYEKGWRNSVTMEEVNTAKTEFHLLEVQDSIVKTLKNKTT